MRGFRIQDAENAGMGAGLLDLKWDAGTIDEGGDMKAAEDQEEDINRDNREPSLIDRFHQDPAVSKWGINQSRNRSR
jgi:hypothetical protein